MSSLQRDATTARVPAVVWIVLWLILSAIFWVATADASVDLRADRLTALAAIDGLNPYVPVYQLAERFGSHLWWTWTHPRTPGAIVLQLPLALVGESVLRFVSVGGTLAAVIATARLAVVRFTTRPLIVLSATAVAAISSLTVEAVTVGAQSSLVALLLVYAWSRLRAGDDWYAGAAVGVAFTLKVFPWLLVVYLLASGKRRAAVAAVGVGVALNGIGLLFPGVGFTGAIRALSSANVSAGLDLNASLVRVLGGFAPFSLLAVLLAVVGLGLAAVIGSRAWDFDRQWFAVLTLSLAVSPLIWSHYALVLIPALVWMASKGPVGALLTGLLVPALLVPFPLFVAWVVIPVWTVATLWMAVVGPSGGGINRSR